MSKALDVIKIFAILMTQKLASTIFKEFLQLNEKTNYTHTQHLNIHLLMDRL